MKAAEKIAARQSLADAANAIISVRDVQMWFFDASRVTVALQGISFTVRRGEIFGLLGPDGCGKSTTLRLLAGILSPTEGRIRVFGQRPERSKPRSRIGYVAQGNAPDPVT